MPEVSVEFLADHPELVPAIAARVWTWWGYPSRDAAVRQLRHEAQRDRVPSVYVAVQGKQPMGMVSLIECNLETHRHLFPWLAGLYVYPEYRRRGIGRALTRSLERDAARLGCRRVYLYTQEAEGFYRRLGWRTIERPVGESGRMAIMTKATTALEELVSQSGDDENGEQGR